MKAEKFSLQKNTVRNINVAHFCHLKKLPFENLSMRNQGVPATARGDRGLRDFPKCFEKKGKIFAKNIRKKTRKTTLIARKKDS